MIQKMVGIGLAALRTSTIAPGFTARHINPANYPVRANPYRLLARINKGYCLQGGMMLDTKRWKRGHQCPKVNACYPVDVLTAEGPLKGETKHISTQQAFVRCKDPLRLYDIASVSIHVTKDESLMAEAEVVWSNRYGPDDEITPRGMMVRFTRLSPGDRQRLHHTIARHYLAKLDCESDRK